MIEEVPMRVPKGYLEAKGVKALDRAVLEPLVLAPTVSVASVVEAMDRKRVRCAAITGPHRRLVGIVTRRDLAQAMVELDESPHRVPVARVMQTRLHTVPTNGSVAEAARMMARYAIRRIPIIDARGTLLGLIDLDRSGLRHGAQRALENDRMVRPLSRESCA
jgi:CBS domain-containing protein